MLYALSLFVSIFALTNGSVLGKVVGESATTSEVIRCFEHMNFLAGGDPNSDPISFEQAEAIAVHLGRVDFSNYCEDLEYSVEAVVKKKNKLFNQEMSTETESESRRRLAVNSDCLPKTSGKFCSSTKAVYITDAEDHSHYDELRTFPTGKDGKLGNFDITILGNDIKFPGIPVPSIGGMACITEDGSYTDDFVVSVVEEVASVIAACLPASNSKLGRKAECAKSETWTFVLKLVKIVKSSYRGAIDIADNHDSLTQASKIQAIFEDRQHIIANQMYLDNQLDKSIFWMEKVFADMFSQLNTIDKLVRTRDVDRPDWNKQTDLNFKKRKTTIQDVPLSKEFAKANLKASV